MDGRTLQLAPFDATAPDRQPGCRIDQFHVDAQPVVLQTHTAFQDVSDLEFGAEPRDVDGLALEASRGLA